MKRLEDVFADCGLFEAHVEGPLLFPLYMLFSCSLANWLVTYELYTIICIFS